MSSGYYDDPKEFRPREGFKVYRCPREGCNYITDNPISYGMHRQYKHNPESKYRRWLQNKKTGGKFQV